MDTKIDYESEEDVENLIYSIMTMPKYELFQDILRHEKEYRGIDWLALWSEGPEGRRKSRQMAKDHLKGLIEEFGLAESEIPSITKRFLDSSLDGNDVQLAPEWGVNAEEANRWKEYSGDELGEQVDRRIKVMQALELTSGSAAASTLTVSIGVVVWLRKAYKFYKTARLAGDSIKAAVYAGIKGVTWGATKVFIATAILAVILEVLLYIMEKEAVVFMILLNMTEDDLKMEGKEFYHGKQTVQFEDPVSVEPVLPMASIIEDSSGHVIEADYWMGLFSAQKKDMALVGSQGAFNFKKCPSFPDSVYVGWDIPLTFLGGNNACLVATDDNLSLEKFAKKTGDDGSLHSVATTSKAKVTARMHSGGGSKGYMSVIFEKR